MLVLRNIIGGDVGKCWECTTKLCYWRAYKVRVCVYVCKERGGIRVYGDVLAKSPPQHKYGRNDDHYPCCGIWVAAKR